MLSGCHFLQVQQLACVHFRKKSVFTIIRLALNSVGIEAVNIDGCKTRETHNTAYGAKDEPDAGLDIDCCLVVNCRCHLAGQET